MSSSIRVGMGVLFLLASTSAMGASTKKVATSEIPERREFPVNPAINPCEDFYGYACSEALAGFKLRDDRSSHTFSFNDSSERLLKKKEAFLKDLEKPQAKLSPRADALSTVFQSCMDAKASAAEERALVSDLSREIAAINSVESYNAFWAKANTEGRYKVWDFGDLGNQDNPRQSDVYLLPDLLTLPERSYYDKPEVMKDFERLIADFFRVLKWDHPDVRAKRLLAFEKAFAQVYPLPAEFRELMTQRIYVSQADMMKKYPALGFDALLDKIPDTVLIREFSAPSNAFMAKAIEDKRFDELRDHLAWKSIAEVLDDAYPEFFKKWFEFSRKHLGGPEKRAPRGERCTKMVMGTFDREIDAELIDVVFPNFPAEKVIALGEKVRQSLIDSMEKSDWLSRETRRNGVAKVRAMKLQLVKPQTEEEWDFNLPATYTKGKPYANAYTVVAKDREKMIARVSKPRNPNIWGMGPLTVNAYYNPSENKFVMPMGILQYPFFDAAASDEVNLGAVGAVIAHEMGHGIDDKGAKYDADGKLKQWMKDDEIKVFKSRGEKLIAQFDAIGHNGKLTLGENMADLSGVTFGFHAAFPGDKGSLENKKAFFLQFARAWCGVMRPKLREMLLKTDPHSMKEARVNEQMKHQAGFAEAYQCKAGDKLWLDPKERVVIW